MKIIAYLFEARIAACFALITNALWLLIWFRRGIKREPPGFLWRTFVNARGVPNGVLLTVFLSVNMMLLCTVCGLLFNRWVPSYIWYSWSGIAVWGIGADSLVTLQTPAAMEASQMQQDIGKGVTPDAVTAAQATDLASVLAGTPAGSELNETKSANLATNATIPNTDAAAQHADRVD